MKPHFQVGCGLFFRLFILCSFLFFPTYSEAVLWNKTVASFGDSVLTLWEVKRELVLARVQRQISQTLAISPMSKDELREIAKTMVVEMLIRSEAESFGIGGLTEPETSDIFSKFKKNFSSKHAFQSFLLKYQWTEDELKRVLARPVQVERFIKEKILSAYIYITDEEIEAYMRDHKRVKKGVAAERLRKRRLYENLKDWILNLKNRSNVRTIWD